MLQEEGSSFLSVCCLVTPSAPLVTLSATCCPPLLLLPAVLAAASCICVSAAVPSESLAMLLLELVHLAVLPIPALCSLCGGVLLHSVCAAPAVAVCAVLLELCSWVLQLGDQTNLILGRHICCTPQALLLSWLLLLLLPLCDVGLEGLTRCAEPPSTAAAAAGATGSSTSCLHLGNGGTQQQ